ncbi:amino acid adenylation domain-containing protein [Nocardia takedensis]
MARSRPREPAVRGGGIAIEYRGLLVRADALAAELAALGVGRGDRVGLVTEPSVDAIAAVLGILRSGAAYVPIDPAHPTGRIRDVLIDAGVRAAVVSHGARHQVAAPGLPLVAAEVDIRAVSTAAPDREPETAAEDPAYLIYTSGSTGEPKGVVVGHDQLAASTSARRSVYPQASVFLLVSPLGFDSSVAGIWGTLTTGGELVVATADEARDPEALVGLIEQHRVTRLLCVPSLYGRLLDAAVRADPERLATLESVIVAGESLSEALVHRHFDVHREGVVLVNEYGPTEATVWASYRWFTEPGPVSIGTPIPGTRLYVLDEDRQPVAHGQQGEIHIAGPGVARGYHERPEASAEVFLDDLFAAEGGGRMYATGDFGRWTPEGALEFLGRRDDQVKIRGHRVELNAVESVLRSAAGVRDAVVVPDPPLTQLIAFVAAEGAVTAADLRDWTADRLPRVMVPSRIHLSDTLPVTANGKADRRRLRELAAATPAASVDSHAADTDADPVAQVSAAWAEVLQTSDGLAVDVNFFDMGGHSMAMYELQDILERRTGVRPSIVALFRHTTIVEQAELISTGASAVSRSRPPLDPPAPRRAARRRPVFDAEGAR